MKRPFVPSVFGLMLVASLSSAEARPARTLSSSVAAAEPVLQWSWSALGPNIGQAGLEVVDLDGDGVAEVVASTSRVAYYSNAEAAWYQLDYGDGYRQEWTSLPYSDAIRRLRVVSTASATVVVVATSSALQVFDGSTKALLREAPFPVPSLEDLEVADLDGDGDLEIVTCDSTDLRIFDFASLAQVTGAPGLGCDRLAVGQSDGDAQAEVALAGNPAGGLVLDGLTFAAQWTAPFTLDGDIALLDVNGDGLDEVICFAPIWDGLRAIDPGTGQVRWESQGIGAGELVVADVNGTDAPEVVVADHPSTIRVLEAATGTELWSLDVVLETITALGAGDADGDGTAEILWATGGTTTAADFLYFADAELHEVEYRSTDLVAPFAGLSAADLGADGGVDVATCSWRSDEDSGGRLLLFDLAQQELTFVGGPAVWGYTGVSITASAAVQLDADPQLEICFGSSGYGPAIWCEDGLLHEIHWTVNFPPDQTVRSLLARDLDGDGTNELLAGTGDSVFALEGETGWLRWRTPPLPPGGWSLEVIRVGNVDAEPDPELVALGGNINSFGLAVVYDAATGAIEGGPFPDMDLSTGALGQLDADPELEIVLGLTFGEVVIMDPSTGEHSAPLVTYQEPFGAIRAADLNHDGVDEILSAAGSALHLFDLATATDYWQSPFLGGSAGESGGLLIANADDDSFLEIVVTHGTGLTVFELRPEGLFADGFESGDTGAWSAAVP